jgi:hypothetical protein
MLFVSEFKVLNGNIVKLFVYLIFKRIFFYVRTTVVKEIKIIFIWVSSFFVTFT